MVETGNLVPSFGRAGELFTRYTGTPVSEATVRRYVERAGDVLLTLPAPEPVGETNAASARLFASVDGAFVPLVGGRWEEVRTLVIGVVSPDASGEPECAELSYFSRKASAEDFVAQAASEVTRRGLEQATAVCFGSDGAGWCQRFPEKYCPDAARVLDFWHGAEHVHTFSKALWPKCAGNQAWWSETMLHDLKHHGPSRLLRSLTGWEALGGRTKTGKEATAALDYFEPRAALMDYPQLRAAGWPIGTGVVESANKLVVEERLKGPGMHWGDAHVNPMLALRNAQCSGRWDESWAATAAVLARTRPPALGVHAKS